MMRVVSSTSTVRSLVEPRASEPRDRRPRRGCAPDRETPRARLSHLRPRGRHRIELSHAGSGVYEKLVEAGRAQLTLLIGDMHPPEDEINDVLRRHAQRRGGDAGDEGLPDA